MRIAFIGLGSIAQQHITAIKKIELKTTFYAVRHQDNAIPLEGIENTQLNSLASLNLDAIILSNPPVYHSKFIEELAPLGIPLMVEKPICTSLKQWEALGCLDSKKLPIRNILFIVKTFSIVKSYICKKVRYHEKVNFYYC